MANSSGVVLQASTTFLDNFSHDLEDIIIFYSLYVRECTCV